MSKKAWVREIRAIVEGLLEIAKIAMPDTYYATDPRVKHAVKFLEQTAPKNRKKKK